MNPTRRYLTILVTLLASEVGLATFLAATEPTADKVRAALQKRAFPWYDATKDTFRPLRPLKDVSKKSTDHQSSCADVSGLAPVLHALMWTLLAVLIAGLLIVAIRTARNVELIADSSAEPAAATVDLETLEALPEPTRGVRDLLGEAARLASQSSFGSAMTFYYSWQLVQLDQQQLIEVQKGKTNRQYSREVRAAKPELVGVFGQSMRLFEDAFFGNLPVTSEDFQQVWDQRDRFAFSLRRTRL